MKVKHLLAILTLVSVVLISGCKKDDFVEVFGICPEVISTSPFNGAIGVPIDKIITVTFNKEMNPATITSASLIIQGATTITGTISYVGTTASFKPSVNLPTNTKFTGRVTTAAMDPMGNALQEDYVWEFTTGSTVAPYVIFTDPADKETNVYLNKIVSATFNVPMDPLSLNWSTFILKHGTVPVGGTVSYSGVTAYFKPHVKFLPNTTYTATINIGAKNVAGTTMANDYVWTFTTGIITTPMVECNDPSDKATDVVLDKIVSSCFTEPMDPLTLTSSTFYVKQGTNTIAGSITYVDSFATFTPTVNLLPGTAYTVTITTGVKNLKGIPLANDFVWSFITKF